MKFLLLILFAGGIAFSVGALGQAEDPAEVQTRILSLGTVKTLEIRGQVEVELVKGPQTRVTVETTRALFDQLNVSEWWGAATIAVETGLRGPRERGTVRARVEVPSLEALSVTDRSRVTGLWPGKGGVLRVGEESSVSLSTDASSLKVEVWWLSAVTLKGNLGFLDILLRHEGRGDTTALTTGETVANLDEGSILYAGPTGKGSGSARHGSRVTVPKADGWAGLKLGEGSVRELRTDQP